MTLIIYANIYCDEWQITKCELFTIHSGVHYAVKVTSF